MSEGLETALTLDPADRTGLSPEPEFIRERRPVRSTLGSGGTALWDELEREKPPKKKKKKKQRHLIKLLQVKLQVCSDSENKRTSSSSSKTTSYTWRTGGEASEVGASDAQKDRKERKEREVRGHAATGSYRQRQTSTNISSSPPPLLTPANQKPCG